MGHLPWPTIDDAQEVPRPYLQPNIITIMASKKNVDRPGWSDKRQKIAKLEDKSL